MKGVHQFCFCIAVLIFVVRGAKYCLEWSWPCKDLQYVVTVVFLWKYFLFEPDSAIATLTDQNIILGY